MTVDNWYIGEGARGQYGVCRHNDNDEGFNDSSGRSKVLQVGKGTREQDGDCRCTDGNERVNGSSGDGGERDISGLVELFINNDRVLMTNLIVAS